MRARARATGVEYPAGALLLGRMCVLVHIL